MAQPPLRLFVEADLSVDAEINLSPEQAHYIATVMRRSVGAPVLLFNGRDGEWCGDIREVQKKCVTLHLKHQTRPQVPSPDLHLLFAPVKRAPLDLIAQKATELGVAALCPIQTERTIVTRVREDRLYANAIEAAEQCERLDVPDIKPLQKLPALLSAWTTAHPSRRILFCDEAGDDDTIRWGGTEGRAASITDALQSIKDNTSWAILIGPEGGFTPKERSQLRSLDYVTTASLGPRILRADTAAFAAITLWQSVLGDLGSDYLHSL